MRIQAVKILESPEGCKKRISVTRNLREFGIEYLLMIRKGYPRIWFGRVSKENVCHIEGFHFSKASDGYSLNKSDYNEYNYSVPPIDEVWYGINKDTFDLIRNCNTVRDWNIVLDSVEVVKDITEIIKKEFT